MTLSKTAELVIKTTATSEGVPLARIGLALDVLQGNSNESPAPVRLLTQKEYAKRWQVTVRTVQRWIEVGQVKAIKRGRVVRIPED